MHAGYFSADIAETLRRSAGNHSFWAVMPTSRSRVVPPTLMIIDIAQGLSGGEGVPAVSDTGSTIVLLGMALVAADFLRRRLAKRKS